MNTLPDFFGGVMNLSDKQRIELFDDLTALFYMIGYRYSNAVISALPGKSLSISISGLSDDEASLIASEIPLRILCKDKVKSLSLLKQKDGSIIATITE